MRNNNQLFINLIKHANLQSIKIISFTKKNSFCSFKLNSGSNEEDNDNSIAIFDGYSLTRNEFIKFQNKLKWYRLLDVYILLDIKSNFNFN